MHIHTCRLLRSGMFLSVRRGRMLGAERRADAVRAGGLDLDHDHAVQQAGEGREQPKAWEPAVRWMDGLGVGYHRLAWMLRRANQTQPGRETPMFASKFDSTGKHLSWKRGNGKKVRAGKKIQLPRASSSRIASCHKLRIPPEQNRKHVTQEDQNALTQLSCISTTSLIHYRSMYTIIPRL